MGEHKRNSTAIYFKENPWAPDFRPLLGKRRPRGKGIRRVYKIMMERSDIRDSQSTGLNKKSSAAAEKKAKNQEGIRSHQILVYENKDKYLRYKFINLQRLLSSLRLAYLRMTMTKKNA